MRYLRIYLIAALFCLASIAQAQTNVLRVGSVTSPAGKTAIIPVELDNASDIMGVQFDIDVPYDLSVSEGVPVVNLSATRCVNHRVESHQTSASRWRDPSTHGGVSSYKTYRFIVYSDENTRLQGSTGTLLTLEMPLPDDLANGTVFPVYLMENSVVLSNRDKVNLVTGQQNGQVTIEVVPRPDLLPTDIKVAQTLASPGDQLDFSWTVKNQGDLATGAGWTERLYLENQTTGSRVYVGTQSYDGTLAVGASVQRNATLTLGELPGISGMCRPVVQIVPAAGCGEIASNAGQQHCRSHRLLAARGESTCCSRPTRTSSPRTPPTASIVNCAERATPRWRRPSTLPVAVTRPARPTVCASSTMAGDLSEVELTTVPASMSILLPTTAST